MTPEPSLSAIILCGGRSSRMGRDKASLKIGGTTFLKRTHDIAARVASDIVVVAGPNQDLSGSNGEFIIVRDAVAFPGPLPAMQLGYETLFAQKPQQEQVGRNSVWVTGCDTPFVTPQIVQSLWHRQHTQDAEVATLTQDGKDNPLLAVYDFQALRRLKPFLEAKKFRATDFMRSLRMLRLPVESISHDQNLPTPTTNLNTQDDLNQAFDPPKEVD